ncbi:lipid phosphate phosphatase, putative [Entamoeba invadens IP1]|uniref:lipid phosphate phosphatase, putative n=1 Tax=Entamoeba invadens IP1 TaxID=370355 RepID=UPI0002C3D6A3|nr:lipid phosphate phosphatase, putative [Entamoeba invadens IP1]ELP94077.1 lipid phosphate phosphatase, putative [Entamoeba invadens IP1]|eukprot:XP_004260848.1 lipid phosphate phosphatase, putative [Entamoeba invadens IP1]
MKLCENKIVNEVMVDLVVVFLCVVISVVMLFINPHHMLIPTEEDNVNMKYPFKNESVPFYVCALVAYVPPLLLLVLFSFLKTSWRYFLLSFLALAFAISLCAAVVSSFKLFAGRPRPHFYDRLAQKPSDTIDVYQSFPSGHSSTIFNGATFLSLLLVGQLHVFSTSHEVWRLALSICPFIVAGVVAISRTRDYYHNFSDILGGAFIGMVSSFIVYVLKFESLFSSHSQNLKILEEQLQEEKTTNEDIFDM